MKTWLIRFGPGCLAIVLGLVGWEVASRVMDAAVIFTGPMVTVSRLATIVGDSRYWIGLGATSLRTFSAFIICLMVAFPVGLLMGNSSFFDRFFTPWLALLRSTPVISVILLGILWFSPDAVPVFVCFLMVVPILAGAVRQGVRQQDVHLLELARVLHWSWWTRTRHLAIPAIAPFLQSSSHFALGTAWKAVAAAEVLSQPHWGLGSRLQEARIYLDTAAVFALTLSIVLLSVAGDLLLRLVFRENPKRLRAKPDSLSGGAPA